MELLVAKHQRKAKLLKMALIKSQSMYGQLAHSLPLEALMASRTSGQVLSDKDLPTSDMAK
jgi:hypothetical protein